MTTVSTLSLVNGPRFGAARMQSDLVRLTKEITTGRHADVGLTLGAGTAMSAKLHIDLTALSAITGSNAVASARLSATSAALTQAATGADALLTQLVQARSGATWPANAAVNGLAALTSTLNATHDGGYLFAGINSSVKPFADFDGAPKAAVEAAFQAKFGMAIGDPAVSTIDAADMTDFLDNEFADLFEDPAWSTWSSAADQPLRTRVSPGQTVDTSTSANQTAMRKLAMVYTMTAALGVDSLGAAAREVVADRAITVAGSAVSALTALRADVDLAGKRVDDATARVELQQSLIETRIATLEGVDPAEAKTRLDMLTTQIEMSYSLTAKLSQLSLLNYV